MTTATIAGRDLDLMVAETVMGWRPATAHFPYWSPPGLRPESNALGHTVPAYSTDLAVAWTVVEQVLVDYDGCPWPTTDKARQHHYGVRIERRTEAQERCEEWRVQFPEVTTAPPHEEMNDGVEATAPSLPLAICMAALKAVANA